MTLSQSLDRLADKGAYSAGTPLIRWGELLRANGPIAEHLAQATQRGRLSPLGELGSLHSGVVTRANAFFLVRELSFDQIPARLHVTRGDLKRISVVVDGLDYVCKIEREYLKPILKGSDSLESIFSVKRSNLRLLDVTVSQEELVRTSATGTLSYLKRGETVEYNVSADDLKGGVPAKRSQVRVRKPFWYSIQTGPLNVPRIVFPEHIDRRYVFTRLDASDNSVVIDTLYSFLPKRSTDLDLVHAGLNSLLTWYQVELRGRSQHGEGVLKVKLPDYRGILIADSASLPISQREAVMSAFAHLCLAGRGPSLDELGSPERLSFDIAYLAACGFQEPEELAILLEQELRALSGERVERRLSVVDAKVTRRKAVDVAASVDAYAARIVAAMPPYPDPRAFVNAGDAVNEIAISGAVAHPIEVGVGLFDIGQIIADGEVIAEAGTEIAAQLVRTVLVIDPSVKWVSLPNGNRLERLYSEWRGAAKRWNAEFDATAPKAVAGLTDLRTKQLIFLRARELLHAGQ